MKKIITVSIIIVVSIIVSITAINYMNNFISESRPNIIKPSETKSNITGKHYEIGISDGVGIRDKR